MTEVRDVRAPDSLPGAKIALVIAATFAIVVAAALGVWLAHPSGGESAVESPSLQIAPADPFSRATPHELERDHQFLDRERWQWSDRGHHRALRPLSRAIDAYLAEESR